jgi:hypothetical protein
MKDTLAAAIRTVLVCLAGLGGFLASHGLVDAADAATLNAAGATLQDALAAIATALVMRLMIYLMGKITGKEVSISDLPLVTVIGLLGAAAAVGTLLPSCSASDWAAFKALPIKSCIVTEQGTVCYSSKGGLEIQVDARSGK